MASADDRNERFALFAFRVWRVGRFVIKSASSVRLANTYSISGFVLAIAAVPLVFLAWTLVSGARFLFP